MSIYTQEECVERFVRLVELKAPGQLSNEAYDLGLYIASKTYDHRFPLDIGDIKHYAEMSESKVNACLSELKSYGLVERFGGRDSTNYTVQTYAFTDPALNKPVSSDQGCVAT